MTRQSAPDNVGLRVAAQRTAAAAALLAIVVGVPAVLAALIGWPLPRTLPSAQSLQDSLTNPLPAIAVVKVLAFGAWLAWAHFTLCVLAEVRAALTGRQLRVPLGGFSQEWADRLVSTALLAGAVAVGTGLTPAHVMTSPVSSTAITAMQTAAARSDRPQPAAAALERTSGSVALPAVDTDTDTDTAEQQEQLVYVVQAPHQGYVDNLWDIAERHLGEGTRWREIYELNRDRPQVGGGKLTDPDVVRVGWQLQMPADAVGLPERLAASSAKPPAAASTSTASTSSHTVQAGQTLRSIAAERLGDESRAREVFALNRARPQPDGQRLVDGDLIRPGWLLELPPQTVETVPAAPQPAAPQPAAPQPAAPQPAAPQAPSAAVPTQAAEAPAAGQAPPADQPEQPVDVTEDLDNDADVEKESGESTLDDLTVAFAGGGTLAAAVLAALVAKRRQRFRERRPGATIGTTPPELATMEKALLTGNARAVADVQFLHEALASLLRTLDGAELPDVVAVRLTEEVLELVQTAERRDAPAPWRVDETGLRWSIDTGADLSDAGEAPAAELAPYPALVTVGYTGAGEHWLIDLERVGAVSLTGDQERCLDLARYLAAELGHNCWSEQLQVSVVGFGAELAELNPSRILYRPSVAVAVASLRSTLTENSEVLAESTSTVLAGRARLDLPGDGWAPHVLLVAPDAPDADTDATDLSALLEAMRAQRSRAAVAIVLAGDDDHAGQTRWALHVDEVGRLTIPALGVELVAHRLPAGEAAELGALLSRTATAPDVSEPRARGDEPWDALADAAGAPLPRLTEQRPADDQGLRVAGETDAVAGPIASVLPLPASTYVSAAATTLADVAQLAPGVDAQTRQMVEESDPDLDADLALWQDPASGVAKLGLLGPLSLVGAGPTPDKRAVLTELVTYLASRPGGVSPAQLTADFWPTGDGTTGRKKVSAARVWLGQDPRTGLAYIPVARNVGGFSSYRVQGLLDDGTLFRRLRLRGVTRGPDGISDLWAALELIRGVPLKGLQDKNCGWLVDTPVHHEYTACIVDVAHLVATHHLAAGEPAEAERAARVALLAGAPDDVPLLDLVAACDAAGRYAEADSYVRQILANNDADVEEDLQPRTYEVLRRRSYPAPTSAQAHARG